MLEFKFLLWHVLAVTVGKPLGLSMPYFHSYKNSRMLILPPILQSGEDFTGLHELEHGKLLN